MAAVAALSTRRSNLIEEADASADFLLLEKLGEGSFGKVYRAQQHSIKRHVAIKVVPVAQDTGEVAREIETLKECDSDNIVRCGPHRRPDTLFLWALSTVVHTWSCPARRYYGSFQRGPELWIVMEFCEGSSLCDIMEARRLGPPWDPPLTPAQPRCRAGCCKASVPPARTVRTPPPQATRRCFTEEQIGAVMAGTLEGLIYLHRLNKIHRDVKAEPHAERTRPLGGSQLSTRAA